MFRYLIDSNIVIQSDRIFSKSYLDPATPLFYAVLIDLSDEIADELTLPFDSISVEMVFRGIYPKGYTSLSLYSSLQSR